MTREGVVSAEVAMFLTNFAELENLCNNAPKDIINISSTNQSILELCEKLYSIVVAMREAELSAPYAFSFPSNPEFKKKWRIYEEDYEEEIFWTLLRSQKEYINVPTNCMNPNLRWLHAEVVSQNYSLPIHELFFVAASSPDTIKEISQSHGILKNETTVSAAEAWDALTEQCGLDPILTLRRRQLLPFVIAPRRRDGDNVKTRKLLKNLEDAQRAFVFGATLAAIVMMRSHMEAVLRDHYCTKGADLEQLIDNTTNLPAGITTDKLHEIRLIANKLAHNGSEKPIYKQKPVDIWVQRISDSLYSSSSSPGKNNMQWLEMEIVHLLRVLRRLIEEAPNQPS
jgi:hypothetical protein